MWFKFTERLTNPEDTVNKAKILRFVSRCHFLTRDLDKAEETVIESLRFDSETSRNHHYYFVNLLLFRRPFATCQNFDLKRKFLSRYYSVFLYK